MKNVFLLFWLILICPTVAPYGFADDLNEYEIVFKANLTLNIQTTTDIEFIKKNTNRVVKTFNFVENNPYQHLEFPVIRQGSCSGLPLTSYDLQNVDPEQVFARFLPHVSTLEKNKYRFIGASCKISYFSPPEGEQSNYTIVSFILTFWKTDWVPMCFHSTMIVLNAKGEETARLEVPELDCLAPMVTPDGRYIAFRYGDVVSSEDDRENIAYGYQIYDALTGKKLVAETRKKGEGPIFDPLWVNKLSNLIRIRIGVSKDSWKFVIIDGDKNKIYTKEYSRQDWDYIKRIDPKGFVFEIPGQGERIDTFEHDFTKEPLK